MLYSSVLELMLNKYNLPKIVLGKTDLTSSLLISIPMRYYRLINAISDSLDAVQLTFGLTIRDLRIRQFTLA